MALKREDINRLYTKYLGRGIGEGDPTQQRISSGQTEEDLLRDILGSPERMAYTQRLAESQVNPTYDIGKRELEQSKQLGLAGATQQETSLGNYYTDLLKGLEKERVRGTGELLNRQSQLGLLRSGGTSTGLGNIEQTTTENTQRALTDKANKLAEIALRRTGLEQTYSGGLERLNLGRTQDIQSILDKLRTGGEQDIQQAHQTRLQQEENARQLEVEKFKLASNIPVGQNIDIPGYGRIEGRMQPEPVSRKTETITAGGRQLLIDSNTGETIRDLGSAYKGEASGGGGSTSKITPTDVSKGQDILTKWDESDSGLKDNVLSREEAQNAINELMALYGDPNRVAQIFSRAVRAGRFSEWGSDPSGRWSFNDLQIG